MTAILAHITLESGKNPQYCTIWLHGLGADGQDFVPVADELRLPVAMRYVFPDAPLRPVTINGGYVMRAWYDIAESDLANRDGNSSDEAGIRNSCAAIDALIGMQIARGIEARHIFLAGFSQGGAIALSAALRQQTPLAGVLALSTYLPMADAARREATKGSRATPIFMAHGRQDPIVPCQMGIASKEALTGMGYRVSWHEYPMQHTVTGQEITDIGAWMTDRIAEPG